MTEKMLDRCITAVIVWTLTGGAVAVLLSCRGETSYSALVSGSVALTAVIASFILLGAILKRRGGVR